MKQLSKTQKRILTAASKEPKSDISPHAAFLKSPAVKRQVIYSMLNSGYVSEDGDSYFITDEGLAALKAKAPKGKEPKAKTTKPAKKDKQKKSTAKKPALKKKPALAAEVKSNHPARGRQLLIDILSHEGATIQQMADATRWQKGAVSGTMSKIKKLLAPQHMTIISNKNDNGKMVYKIAKSA